MELKDFGCVALFTSLTKLPALSVSILLKSPPLDASEFADVSLDEKRLLLAPNKFDVAEPLLEKSPPVLSDEVASLFVNRLPLGLKGELEATVPENKPLPACVGADVDVAELPNSDGTAAFGLPVCFGVTG